MKANFLTKETILNYGITDRGFPNFNVGDTIEVTQIIREAGKERTQLFEGTVLKIMNHGIASNFTIRRIGANGIGVEKILPYHAQTISAIRLIKQGKVRRADIGYIRERLGKAARVEEKIVSKAKATDSAQ